VPGTAKKANAAFRARENTLLLVIYLYRGARTCRESEISAASTEHNGATHGTGNLLRAAQTEL